MNAIEIQVEQGSHEWHSIRSSRIGSSDAAAILGKSKWDTQYSLFMKKLGFGPLQVENEAMRRGNDKEPTARQSFINKTGILVIPKVFIKEDFMIASFDGVDFNNEYAVEIKVPGVIDHQMALDGEIPEYYKPQMLHQMIVLGIPMVYYYSWNEDSQALIEYKYNEQEAKELIEKEKEFYKCLQDLTPPSFTERDYIQRTDSPWMTVSDHYKEVVKKRKEIELEEQSIREELIALAGGLNCQGNDIKMSKVVKRGNIQYKNIEVLKDIKLDDYRSPNSEYWRISQ